MNSRIFSSLQLQKRGFSENQAKTISDPSVFLIPGPSKRASSRRENKAFAVRSVHTYRHSIVSAHAHRLPPCCVVLNEIPSRAKDPPVNRIHSAPQTESQGPSCEKDLFCSADRRRIIYASFVSLSEQQSRRHTTRPQMLTHKPTVECRRGSESTSSTERTHACPSALPNELK